MRSPAFCADNLKDFSLLKKVSLAEKTIAVPQTDTGGLVEKTKASERRRFKELGKSAGRNLGICPSRILRDAAKVCLPTVYQKHWSLQRRKPKYRG